MEENREPIAMEQELVDTCKPVTIPFSEPADAEKPLESTALNSSKVNERQLVDDLPDYPDYDDEPDDSASVEEVAAKGR